MNHVSQHSGIALAVGGIGRPYAAVMPLDSVFQSTLAPHADMDVVALGWCAIRSDLLDFDMVFDVPRRR